MHIAFITGSYPTPGGPSDGTFVQQFVWAMARQGNECSVIKPTSIFARRHGPFQPRRKVQDAGGGCSVTVHQPLYLSFSSKDLGWTHTGRWTQRSSTVVADRTIASLARRPNLIYGHFLYPAGYAALKIGRALGCPTVVGVVKIIFGPWQRTARTRRGGTTPPGVSFWRTQRPIGTCLSSISASHLGGS